MITEVLFEFSGSDVRSLRAAARFHATLISSATADLGHRARHGHGSARLAVDAASLAAVAANLTR